MMSIKANIYYSPNFYIEWLGMKEILTKTLMVNFNYTTQSIIMAEHISWRSVPRAHTDMNASSASPKIDHKNYMAMIFQVHPTHFVP